MYQFGTILNDIMLMCYCASRVCFTFQDARVMFICSSCVPEESFLTAFPVDVVQINIKEQSLLLLLIFRGIELMPCIRPVLYARKGSEGDISGGIIVYD